MRLAIAVLAGCASGRWEHVTVRMARSDTPHRRTHCLQPRGPRADELAEPILRFARAYLADLDAELRVDVRDNGGWLQISQPAGRWRTGTDYCIGVVTSATETTILVSEDRQWFR